MILGRRRFIAAVAAALAARGATAQSPLAGETAIPPIGTRIDVPDVVQLDGTPLPASYWRGKVLVVELWASWCPFCAKQNPLVDKLHRTYAAQGLEVLALSIDRSEDDARRYLRAHGYAFRAAMFDARWQAAIGRPRAIPAIWVVDRDGRLAHFEAREMFAEDVAELARFLLGQRARTS
jgi:thiol-disulfide isomerase/thioredoxin